MWLEYLGGDYRPGICIIAVISILQEKLMKKQRIYRTKSFLESVGARATRILRQCGIVASEGEKRKYTRRELNANEKMAHVILDVSKYGPCAELARNMVDIVVSVDENWVQMFPVFDLIDHAIQKENCTLEATQSGYVLRDSLGRSVSTGATLRQFLQAHGLLRSDLPVAPYDREAE